MATDQSAPNLKNRGHQIFGSWEVQNMKFTEACVMCMKKHVLVNKCLQMC